MTADRLAALAQALTDATGIAVAAEPGAPGRGDLFAFLEPPTFILEATARTFCPGGRAPALRSAIVLVGSGTAPGQMSALVDAAEAVVLALDVLEVPWFAGGDAVPATFQDIPAYSIPVRTR